MKRAILLAGVAFAYAGISAAQNCDGDAQSRAACRQQQSFERMKQDASRQESERLQQDIARYERNRPAAPPAVTPAAPGIASTEPSVIESGPALTFDDLRRQAEQELLAKERERARKAEQEAAWGNKKTAREILGEKWLTDADFKQLSPSRQYVPDYDVAFARATDDPALASAALQRVLRVVPSVDGYEWIGVHNFYALARAYVQLGRFDDAIALMRKYAEKNDGNVIPALMLRQQVLREQDELTQHGRIPLDEAIRAERIELVRYVKDATGKLNKQLDSPPLQKARALDHDARMAKLRELAAQLQDRLGRKAGAQPLGPEFAACSSGEFSRCPAALSDKSILNAAQKDRTVTSIVSDVFGLACIEGVVSVCNSLFIRSAVDPWFSLGYDVAACESDTFRCVNQLPQKLGLPGCLPVAFSYSQCEKQAATYPYSQEVRTAISEKIALLKRMYDSTQPVTPTTPYLNLRDRAGRKDWMGEGMVPGRVEPW